MIDENKGFAVERELHVKKIKRILDNWREVSLVVNSVLLWKKKFYPWSIVAFTTVVFMQFAYYSPSFLTTVGLLCAVATIIDYGGPSISSVIWRYDDWNAAKEREFEEICRSISGIIVYIKQYWAFVMDMKAARPYMYFMVTISSSLTLALLGNSINNVLMLYFICLASFMLPGMVHYGILQKYYSIGISYLVNILRSFNSSITKTKVQ